MAFKLDKPLGLILIIILINCMLDFTNCQSPPRLEILPIQSIQKKPVGKSLMLTCRPDVPDVNLVSDLQWKDNLNNTVLAKTFGLSAPMYTEVLPGDQSLALFIPSLTTSMAGTYYCTASYANTEILSISAKIETYVAITWVNAELNQYPTVGSSFTIQCEVNADPAPTVDWLRNGDAIKTGDRYVIETRGLYITNVQESDDGVYTCRAAVIQTGELVERNIVVEVQVKPKIEPLPIVIDAIEEKPFSIMCNATGKPVPEYTWVKDHSQLNVAHADRFIVNPLNGQMNILRVTHEDHGNYTCHAKNSAGEDTATTLINVLLRPRIYELKNTTAPQNELAELTCKATGRPAPYVTFKRFGTDEEFVIGQQREDIFLEQSTDNDRGEASGTLRFMNLRRSDDGLYECIARNKGERAVKVGHITVEYPPNFNNMNGLPPVFSWERRKVNVTCIAEGFPNATIEWRMDNRLIISLHDPHLQVVGSGPRSDLIVTPVAQHYYRPYKCIAANKLATVERDIVLREAFLPALVVQALPKIVTATTITFEIIGPATEQNLPITAYTVQFKDLREPDWLNSANKTWSPDSIYIVEGLLPERNYQFRFAARNQVGLGQWGANVQQSTPRRSAPEPPRIAYRINPNIQPEPPKDGEEILIYSEYSDHYDLAWSVPPDNGEPINFYQIKYCPGFKVDNTFNQFENDCIIRDVPFTSSTSLQMTDLKGDAYYNIEVRAHNAIGFSQPSKILVRTALGSEMVVRMEEKRILSSAAIIGIAVGSVLLLILIIDFICCMLLNAGIMAVLCRRTKRSPSDLDDEMKLGRDEREPLNNGQHPISIKKNSSVVEFDGRIVHSRSGEVIGKNSSV